MADLIVNMLIASVVLTALINVIPRVFPGSSAEDRVRDLVGEPRTEQSHLSPGPADHADSTDAQRPPFRVWFPWKSMLVGSILVTAIVNIVAFFS